MPSLSLHNIAYSTKSKPIFEAVNFSLLSGQSLGLSGASGAGKSSLLRVILGLVAPTAGRIELNHQDITGFSRKQRTKLRRDIFATSPQNPHIIPSLNVRENIALAANIRRKNDGATIFAVNETLERFHAAHLAARYVDHLSGGEQRRVALARAFVGAPQIICLDEPTEGLDAELTEDIINAIFDTGRELGASLIIASHDPDLIARCDQRLDIDPK